MKIYKVEVERHLGYDTYDSVIVAATSEADARTIHPSGYEAPNDGFKWIETMADGSEYEVDSYSWVEFSEIGSLTVNYIGETAEDRGVILASFNAG